MEDHQVEMVVEIDKTKFESAKHKAAQKISQKVKIPGFRPGKAPYQVVKNMYGDGAITEEDVKRFAI
jgi:trigger factor